MQFNLQFNIGDYVYLTTDPNQYQRIVTGFTVRQNGVMYAVTFETSESWHYDFEMSNNVDKMKYLNAN